MRLGAADCGCRAEFTGGMPVSGLRVGEAPVVVAAHEPCFDFHGGLRGGAQCGGAWVDGGVSGDWDGRGGVGFVQACLWGAV